MYTYSVKKKKYRIFLELTRDNCFTLTPWMNPFQKQALGDLHTWIA